MSFLSPKMCCTSIGTLAAVALLHTPTVTEGLTLVHVSAQLEPFLTQNTPEGPPKNPVTPPTHPLKNPYMHPLSHSKRLS